MQVTKIDVELCEKLLKTFLHKATLKVSGEEVIAAHQLIVWLSQFGKRMEESIKAESAKAEEPAIKKIEAVETSPLGKPKK